MECQHGVDGLKLSHALAAFALFALLPSCAFSDAAISPPPFAPAYELAFQVTMAGAPIPADSILQVQYAASDGKEYGTAIVAKQGGRATLYAGKAVESATLAYDDPQTPSLDGVWSGSTLSVPNVTLASLQPIAEVAGVALLESGQPAQGALLELRCPNGYDANATASATGAFGFARASAGTCVLFAKSGDAVSSQQIPLLTGDFASVQATLKTPFPFLPAAAGVLVLAVAAYFIFTARKKIREDASPAPSRGRKNASSQPPAPAQQPNVPNARQSDLLATLDEKERKIIEYVQHHAPSSVRVSRLRRDLLIPKTSLTLSALERKQFLKIGKVGARTYAELHGFYRKAE